MPPEAALVGEKLLFHQHGNNGRGERFLNCKLVACYFNETYVASSSQPEAMSLNYPSLNI